MDSLKHRQRCFTQLLALSLAIGANHNVDQQLGQQHLVNENT